MRICEVDGCEAESCAKGMCRKHYSARYRAENPDKVREYKARYYAENRDKRREYNARWRAENPDKERERAARWRAENRDKERERTARYRSENPDKERERQARWRAENPDKGREHEARRRARKANVASEPFTTAAVHQRDSGVCGLCGQHVHVDDLHIDHVMPLSRSGPTIKVNLQAAHSKCNISKGPRDSLRDVDYPECWNCQADSAVSFGWQLCMNCHETMIEPGQIRFQHEARNRLRVNTTRRERDSGL